MADAFLLTSTLSSWDKTPTGQQTVMRLIDAVWRFRAPGDFLNYMLVAEGSADICIEPDPKQWDIEAPGLIITEAGGKIWSNATNETLATEPRISVATNGLLEATVLAALHLS
jgi:histidinol-phosphatase